MTDFYKTILIGSSGGIGKALKDELIIKFGRENVICFSKSKDRKLDITNEEQIERAADELKKNSIKSNLLINAIGYLHDENFLPEKKVSEINSNYLLKSFQINTIGHALIIKYFSPLLDHEKLSVLACLSARVGSISDNYLGGWFGYRSSKAALNQIVKSSSIEFNRKKSNLIFASIHPGTVYTNLSKPFVKNKKISSPSESAKNILKVIYNLKLDDSGNFIDYNGNIIPY